MSSTWAPIIASSLIPLIKSRPTTNASLNHNAQYDLPNLFIMRVLNVNVMLLWQVRYIEA